MGGTAYPRRRQRRMVAEMNVVPYIDVMLVLLIIFMVSAPLLSPAVVDLPRTRTRRTSGRCRGIGVSRHSRTFKDIA